VSLCFYFQPFYFLLPHPDFGWLSRKATTTIPASLTCLQFPRADLCRTRFLTDPQLSLAAVRLTASRHNHSHTTQHRQLASPRPCALGLLPRRHSATVLSTTLLGNIYIPYRLHPHTPPASASSNPNSDCNSNFRLQLQLTIPSGARIRTLTTYSLIAYHHCCRPATSRPQALQHNDPHDHLGPAHVTMCLNQRITHSLLGMAASLG
jgi:hypothetical protein